MQIFSRFDCQTVPIYACHNVVPAAPVVRESGAKAPRATFPTRGILRVSTHVFVVGVACSILHRPAPTAPCMTHRMACRFAERCVANWLCAGPPSPSPGNATLLFDIEADPTEVHDLSTALPSVLASLMQRLMDFVAESIPQDQSPTVGHPSERPTPALQTYCTHDCPGTLLLLIN